METPIHDFLTGYAAKEPVRLHMPGSKGLEYPFDITEIEGADVLYESSGIIRRSEDNAARLFGAAGTCYSCGGATLAVQAMIYAACAVSGKRKIAAGRFSHRSLVSAAVLLGLDINFAYPDEFPGCRISPEQADAAIDDDTAVLFVNSVDYIGEEADIPALAQVCRRRGVFLIVDNAHGAYKVFTGDHPITCGADMTADSAHKTLPAMTGAAYLHMADSRFYGAAKEGMALFGSSSPSYLMLDSLDLCNRFISDERERALGTIRRIGELREELLSYGIPLRGSDAMRITIDAAAYGYTGGELAGLMRAKGAECEMGADGYTVLLFSVVQPESDISRTAEILRSIPAREPGKPEKIPVIRPEKVMSPREAFLSRRGCGAGDICAEICSPCPPCVPVIIPGERLTPEISAVLKRYGVERIMTTSGK